MKQLAMILLTLLLGNSLLLAEDQPEQPTQPGAYTELDDLNPREWGIDNGCIQTSRIQNFRYFEAGAARVTLVGGKEVIMRFTNKCSGFRHNGIIYETRIGKLCAGFDSVRVLKQGTICPIESIEPYVEPAINEQKEPSGEATEE